MVRVRSCREEQGVRSQQRAGGSACCTLGRPELHLVADSVEQQSGATVWVPICPLSDHVLTVELEPVFVPDALEHDVDLEARRLGGIGGVEAERYVPHRAGGRLPEGLHDEVPHVVHRPKRVRLAGRVRPEDRGDRQNLNFGASFAPRD